MAPKNTNNKKGFFARFFGSSKQEAPKATAANKKSVRKTTAKPQQPKAVAAPKKLSIRKSNKTAAVENTEHVATVPQTVQKVVSKEVVPAKVVSPAAAVERVVLPSYVVPTHYDLTITPNLSGDFVFDASTSAHLTLNKEGLKEIKLHSQELVLKNATYRAAEGKTLTSTSFDYDVEAKTVVIAFDEELVQGDCVVDIEFTGIHNQAMAGFYRSGYKNALGEECIMVSTQFEALSARRCFPCVDEPAAKATFTAHLIVDAHLTALSNMPESSCVVLEGGDKKKVSFLPSPKMSTYLLAFVVGEFDYCSDITDNGVLVRVYTPPTKCHLGNFALDAGKKCLDFYDRTFGVPYPLPKLDMVAIPEFAAGAMENWGLVTYREVELLIDDLRASNAQKQRVCSVVTHELAHQWFGNLVTMNWWDDLWLNEGFAAWTQNQAADFLHPEWSMWEQFVVEEQNRALALDSLASSHPIQVPIKHAEEVEEVFDGISYQKGASVVRMLFAYLGEKHFLEGLQLYMKRHQYGNTETTDLWNAWEEVSGLPISGVMASWTQQMGYPVVTVNSSEVTKNSIKLNLHQEWFLSDGSPADDKLWSVPLLVSVGNGKETKTINAGLMTERTMELTVDLPFDKVDVSSVWFKLNGGQHVPMRVAYTSDNLAKLSAAVESKQMGNLDRTGLVLDMYELAKAGRMDAGDLLSVLAAYKNEDQMPVWRALEATLTKLKALLMENDELSRMFGRFARNLIVGPAKQVGFSPKPTDGHLGGLLRQSLVELQATFMTNDPELVAECRRRYDEFMKDPKSEAAAAVLPSDFRVSVFRVVLQNAENPDDVQQQLKDLLAAAETVADKKEVYYSLGFHPMIPAKKEVLEWATSGEVKLQDFFYPIMAVTTSNKDGRDLAYCYMKEHYDRIFTMVKTASPSLMSAVVGYSMLGFSSNGIANDFEAFFKEHHIPSIQRRVDQIIESIRGSATFLGAVEESASFRAALRDVRSVQL